MCHHADFVADRKTAERSVLIKNMLEDMGVEGSPDEAIPINNVSSFFPIRSIDSRPSSPDHC